MYVAALRQNWSVLPTVCKFHIGYDAKQARGRNTVYRLGDRGSIMQKNIYGIPILWIAYRFDQPVTVAERSNSCTVFARLEAGVVGSNPTQGMDI
jgi:hypothetical protein